MPIKVTYQNPGLEYDENMVCEDFLNMGMLPLEDWLSIDIGWFVWMPSCENEKSRPQYHMAGIGASV